MEFTPLALIVNSIFLLVAFGLAFRMMRAGTTHQLNNGDNAVQDRMKWIILRCIMALVVLALVASVFNLLQFFGAI